MQEYRWEILRGRVDPLRSTRPLSAFRLFVIQHVLDDLTHLIQAFIDLGCVPADITVVGIPYSSRQDAAVKIQGLGCRVFLPQVFPMDGIVAKLLLDDLASAAAAKKHLIILEDGAYAVPQLCQMAREHLVSLDWVKGAVEQTTRGKWLDQRLERDGYLALPVISIPDCHTKQTIEPPYIAQAVVKNLSAILNHVSGGQEIKVVGMYGSGAIGNQVAKYFTSQGAQVSIAELSAARRFEVLTSQSYSLLKPTILSACDLLLGSTGATSIGPEIILALKNGSMVASTSSRQIEIDIDYLRRNSLSSEELGPAAPCVMPIPAARRFTLAQKHGSKKITVLYDGYPINFWGTSLPDHVADAVLSLLLEGVLAIALDEHQAAVLPGGVILEDADVEITNVFGVIRSELGLA